MDTSFNYPLEFLVGSDSFYNLIQTRLEDPNQKNPAGYTLLHTAALICQENTSIVKLLIEKGADVNATTPYGHTPLHFAVCSRKRDAVVTLIEAGASINSSDFLKRTALHFAITTKCHDLLTPIVNVSYDIRIVETLLRNPEIELSPVDEMGETPLMWAAKERHFREISLLLKKGADPNILNKDNRTPLHEALSLNTMSPFIVFKLLGNGAGIYCVDQLGLTPVDILLGIAENKGMFPFVKKCVSLITLRYRITAGLKRQLGANPLLYNFFEKCCKEVSLMKKHVIYDNVSLHDFALDCFQSQDLMNVIYKKVIEILKSGLYIEYRDLILYRMSNKNLLSQFAKVCPELHRSIFGLWIYI